jgi:hypothetical protein
MHGLANVKVMGRWRIMWWKCKDVFWCNDFLILSRSYRCAVEVSVPSIVTFQRTQLRVFYLRTVTYFDLKRPSPGHQYSVQNKLQNVINFDTPYGGGLSRPKHVAVLKNNTSSYVGRSIEILEYNWLKYLLLNNDLLDCTIVIYACLLRATTLLLVITKLSLEYQKEDPKVSPQGLHWPWRGRRRTLVMIIFRGLRQRVCLSAAVGWHPVSSQHFRRFTVQFTLWITVIIITNVRSNQQTHYSLKSVLHVCKLYACLAVVMESSLHNPAEQRIESTKSRGF